MPKVRNLLLFMIASLIIGGCGGGNTSVADNSQNSTSNSTSNNTTNNTGSSKGSITLHWIAPTTRLDNSSVSLSDISSYQIYYGTSITDITNVISINDGTATQYTVTLPSGSYYFRISAVDSNGNEGQESAAVQKTL